MPFDGLESPFNYLAKFDQVIDLIGAPGGWSKGAYRTPEGRYCLKEALNIAGVAEIFEPIILQAAAEAADREFCSIESFNDRLETTHEDDILVLRRVREDIVAGRITLPASVTPGRAFAWAPRTGTTAESRLLGLWRKLFS
ncbi:MAG TPA: hypothetical protein VGR70_00180 [Stellaceae bacterium]|nr:hypothetical protein [Stellaceae bacterium]